MTAQIWLWVLLSGLGIGAVGWLIRGWQASGRELRIKRQWENRLCSVEEDARRFLVRARDEAADDRRRLEAQRDTLYAWLVELDPVRAASIDVGGSLAIDEKKSGAPGPESGTSKRPRRRRPRSTAADGNGRSAAADGKGRSTAADGNARSAATPDRDGGSAPVVERRDRNRTPSPEPVDVHLN